MLSFNFLAPWAHMQDTTPGWHQGANIMFGAYISQMINRDPKNHISLQDWATPEMLVPMFEEEREREMSSLINKFT